MQAGLAPIVLAPKRAAAEISLYTQCLGYGYIAIILIVLLMHTGRLITNSSADSRLSVWVWQGITPFGSELDEN
jgi:hypothetical protein